MPNLDRVQVRKPDKSILRIDYRVERASDYLELLLRSDAHHDNSHSDQDMERRHLEEAKRRNALILDNGDLHCAMQGKWDRRASRDAMRPEYQYGNYLDRLVDEAVRFYEPFKRNWCMMGLGNHETAILKHHETNLTERVVEALKPKGAVNLHACGYAGWVRIVLHGHSGSKTGSIWLYRHHGQWVMPIERYRVTGYDRTYLDRQTHVRTPGYKEEFSQQDGWHIERGGPPKPRGALWLKVWLANNSIAHYEISEAR